MKFDVTLKSKFAVDKVEFKKGHKRAFVGVATIVINGVAISSVTVTRDIVDAKKKKLGAYHIAMPARKGSDDKYYNICWVEAETEDAKKVYDRITELIEKEFEEEE